MFGRLFELLFKYRPVVFQQGDLAFAPPWPAAAILIALGAVVAIAVTYRRVRPAAFARASASLDEASKTRSRAGAWRELAILGGLRLAALACTVFSLAGPVLVVRAVEPQRNFLAVLLDDSRSLSIADRDGRSRSAFVTEAFGAEAALRSALASRFTLRFFRFSSALERVADPAHERQAAGELEPEVVEQLIDAAQREPPPRVHAGVAREHAQEHEDEPQRDLRQEEVVQEVPVSRRDPKN